MEAGSDVVGWSSTATDVSIVEWHVYPLGAYRRRKRACRSLFSHVENHILNLSIIYHNVQI